MLWASSPAVAQDAVAETDLQPLPEKVLARFDQMFAEIEVQKEDIRTLDTRSADYEGLIAELLGTRRDRIWISMFQNTATLARDVAAQKAGGKDVSAYQDRIIVELKTLPDGAYEAVQRFRDRAEYPSADLPPKKFVIADQKLFKQLEELDNINRAMSDYIEIADDFGLDATEERDYMVSTLLDGAANRSIFLELAL